jgi:endoglucanase
MRKRRVELFSLLLLAASLRLAAASKAASMEKDAFQYNRALGRGVNLGNALDAPKEGAWGITLQEDYFKTIKEAGFDSVRIPVSWSTHAQREAPFAIDPVFFERVDWAIRQALSRGLVAVIDDHHNEGMEKEPEKNLPRLKAIWKQVAERYRNQPDGLSFEILNEPTGKLTDALWNEMFPQLLGVIRASNTRRIVIVGPGRWNNLSELDALTLPENDRRLIVTFHYYSPMSFTHQAASWIKGSDKWKGNAWTGTLAQRVELRRDFDKAAAWGKKNGRPLYLGEFGAYSAADMDSRARWTRAVAGAADERGMSRAYWEFASGFGVYDPKANAWRKPLLNALLGAD